MIYPFHVRMHEAEVRGVLKFGSVPKTPDADTSAKASRYKWQVYFIV